MLHIVIFAGFLVLSIRSISLVMQGIFDDFTMPGFSGAAGDIYIIVKDYAATLVFIAAVAAAVRRGMVDDGNVPQSLQKPLAALEKRGNPYGKMERKRADWAKDRNSSKFATSKFLTAKTVRPRCILWTA